MFYSPSIAVLKLCSFTSSTENYLSFMFHLFCICIRLWISGLPSALHRRLEEPYARIIDFTFFLPIHMNTNCLKWAIDPLYHLLGSSPLPDARSSCPLLSPGRMSPSSPGTFSCPHNQHPTLSPTPHTHKFSTRPLLSPSCDLSADLPPSSQSPPLLAHSSFGQHRPD